METPTFTCQPCNFTTSLKANLVRHQNTAKHVKICECQEVVTKTVIEVVNTENKEPINSVNNQLLDKMEELTKKNESLEETIKKLQKTIELMAAVVNHIAEQKMEQMPSPTLEVEKNEPINVVIPISIPLEPIDEPAMKAPLKLKYEDSNEIVKVYGDNGNYTDVNGNSLTVVVDEKDKKKRVKNKIVLLEEEKKEEKKEESFAEKEKMMRMEMELKELKAKTSDNPIDYIEDTHKYMAQEVQHNKRKQILEIDTVYGLCMNYSSQYLPTNLIYNEQEGLPDCEKEYRAMVIKFLKNELLEVDENKRPIVYYKKQLYIRKIAATDDGLIYQWFPIEINELIKIVDNGIYEFYLKLKTDDPALTNFMNNKIKEEKYSKVLDAIMPLILLK